MKRVLTFVALFLVSCSLFIVFIYFYYFQKQPNFSSPVISIENSPAKTIECDVGESAVATKVIDGDTIIVEGGYSIRLLGIDADEKDYPCYDSAKKRLEELALSKQARLEKDKTDTDKYGRCLRTVFIADKNINIELVKEGLAVARFYEPDIKYKNEIIVAEKQAIENKVGCKWQQ